MLASIYVKKCCGTKCIGRQTLRLACAENRNLAGTYTIHQAPFNTQSGYFKHVETYLKACIGICSLYMLDGYDEFFLKVPSHR